MDIEVFKERLISLPHRRFGTVCQILIKKLYKLLGPQNNFHDLTMPSTQQRVEVKFSVVRRQHGEPITEENVLKALSEPNRNSILGYASLGGEKFECNINQVKPAEFDCLYYGLIFDDCIMIFMIQSGEIVKEMGYSDKQHKGNQGEGQFHINNRNLDWHLANKMIAKITWKDFYMALATV